MNICNPAHFKRHAIGGFEGVLKNTSIGVAYSHGKRDIHSAGNNGVKTIVNSK